MTDIKPKAGEAPNAQGVSGVVPVSEADATSLEDIARDMGAGQGSPIADAATDVPSSPLLGRLFEIIRPAAVYLGFWRQGNPIVPERSVASQTLMIVVAIMSFLACLTFAMVTVIWDQTTVWQSDIAREITIQVRPVDGVDLDSEILKAIDLARNTPGILNVQPVDEEWSERLLEPWLGRDFDLKELPVPKMIVIELDPDRRANLSGLSERLVSNVAGVSLDDHRIWLDRLASMANTTVFIGFALMGLMLTAMILSVTFATQSAMTTNHDVVEVLHFVGGRDRFIAGEFQRRFLGLGLKGGCVGGVVAIVCFIALGFWARSSVATPQGDQLAALFGRFEIGFTGYLGTLLLIFVVAGLTALTSRIAVFRYLSKMS
ncbi:MAG: ABC transporter permease [Pseudomonadota bacterium]